MILTKDNLLRHIREKKYVTPTTIAESFETTTMIASAALSGLAKDKLIAITELKLSSTPYYYDPNQPEALIEIGEKHLKDHEKEIFYKLKEQEIVNEATLPIAQRLAAERLKDFAETLEIEHDGKILKFWVWYLRDIKETKKQILEVLNPKTKTEIKPKKETPKPDAKKTLQQTIVKTINPNLNSTTQKQTQTETEQQNPFTPIEQEIEQEDKVDLFIKNYFKQNYLKLEEKKVFDKYTKYNLSLKINKITLLLEAIYFNKKPQDSQILKFYTSSNKPKIIFIENAAKKHFKLAESLDNLEIINV